MKILPRNYNIPHIGFKFESHNYIYTIIDSEISYWKLKYKAKHRGAEGPCTIFYKNDLNDFLEKGTHFRAVKK